MKRAARLLAVPVACCVLLAGPVEGEEPGATLRGTLTDSSGTPALNAKVVLRNVATDQTLEATTDTQGLYEVSGLAPGTYEVSASAEGLSAKAVSISLAEREQQRLDISLAPVLSGLEGPSLGELGFGPEQTKGSAEQQARLDKRSHMLKIHQRLGLATTLPLFATLLSSGGAGGRQSSTTGRDIHAALGGLTAGMYLTTASFAIFAPKVEGTKSRGPIRFHKAMVWIHGPGMILTPILGALAYNEKSKGEKVHGIAQAHGPVAVATAASYTLALLSVSVKF